MQDILLFIQTHWALSLAAAVVLTLLFILELIRGKRGTKQVSASQLTQLMNHQDGVVVDIRPADAFKAGHIVGAVSLPLSDFESKFKKLDKFKSKPIIIACANGLDSPKAVSVLNTNGISAFILAGGIRGWREADMPLVKD